MPRLLHLDSSADIATSVSRTLTREFAAAWVASGQNREITYRDLHAEPLPHLPAASLHWATELRPPDMRQPSAVAASLQAELLDELAAADALVIGAPLYNYSMPSALKAWVDHVQVGGVTSPSGSQPRFRTGKPAVVIVTRGAIYDSGTVNEGRDHGSPVLQLILGDVMGFKVEIITLDRTLARVSPAMSREADRYDSDLRDARERVNDLAIRVSGQVPSDFVDE